MITRELKIGDKVICDWEPDVIHTVIDFIHDGDIALLDTRVPTSYYRDQYTGKYTPSDGTSPNRFIWRFDTCSKGNITYNPMWSIVE